MKKFFSTLFFALVVLTGKSQTIGEAFYIYRNDGAISGFVRSDVDSIVYSNYDADSIFYDEIVTQLIYTTDSVFCIPLAVIDSVSFFTPKTIYKPNVINLSDELMPYITGCNSFTIMLNASTPQRLFPKVGDKLVTTEMNAIFPVGFAGEVTAVDGNQIICKDVRLEDVFDTYYNVSSVYGYVDTEESLSSKSLKTFDRKGDLDFRLNTFTIQQTTEISKNVKPNSDLALKGGTGFSVEITPALHIHTMLIISPDEGTYFDFRLSGTFNLKEKISLYGGIEWSHDFLDNYKIEEPVAPYVTFFFNPGLFLRANALASVSTVMEQEITFAATRDFSTKGRNVIKPSLGGHLASSNIHVEGCIDGSIAGGAFVEIGASLVHSELDKVYFRGELGGEFTGDAVLYNSDLADEPKETKTYEKFKQSSFGFNAFVSTALQGELVGGLWAGSVPLPWNLSYNINTWDVVPTFTNTSFNQLKSTKTSADAKANLTGKCLFPVSVGQRVVDKDGEKVDEFWDEQGFRNTDRAMSHTFTNLSTDEEYTMYPTAKLFGYEMLASPSTELKRYEMPVEITDFRQTKAEYEENGFNYNGRYYSYKYSCSVTVNLNDSENVEDWGYVYEDPNGNTSRISLKNFSTPYTDSRYVYYRNESQSTVRLYEYVKYKNDTEYYYCEAHDYSVEYREHFCPDDNHPHMIDLGLPSGTKWACCNVGAHSPEEFGGYYAWGETEEKSCEIYYDAESTYKYCYEHTFYDEYGAYSEYIYIHIGDDIAGTSYDVAHVKWGGGWRMPSAEQMDELINICQSSWISQNGVYGRVFVGPNGNCVFLPEGCYRSSTLYQEAPPYLGDYPFAYTLFLDGEYYFNTEYIRWPGLPVRPVCK